MIKGGKIYTTEDQQPIVEAVAVKGGKILFAGTEAEAAKYTSGETEIIILKEGMMMTPGFIEGHGHIMGIGYAELNLNLLEVKVYEMVEMVNEAAQKAAPGEWIVGRGWHQDKWDKKPEPMINGFPVHDQLSGISPENPVFFYHASGHAAFANAQAMEIAGLNQLGVESFNKDVEGGEIIKDNLGNPTGLFNERAMHLIDQHIPETVRQAMGYRQVG